MNDLLSMSPWIGKKCTDESARTFKLIYKVNICADNILRYFMDIKTMSCYLMEINELVVHVTNHSRVKAANGHTASACNP